MKRSNSSDGFSSSRKAPKTARYVGRYSLPKLQSNHKKKVKPRMRNTRTSDFLEEYNEEFSQDEYYSRASTSSANRDAFLMLPDSQSHTKSSEFDRLRYELKSFADESRPQDSIVNSQDTHNRGEKIGTYMWLNLQAFFANRDMSSGTILHSLEVQERLLIKLRLEKSSVLTDIANFKVTTNQNQDLSWICAVYDKNYMGILNKSHVEIGQLLDRYDAYCCLFPNNQSMIQLSDITSEIQNRIQILYLWHNSLTDLYLKIQQIGSYFELLNDKRKNFVATLPRQSIGGSSSDSSSKLDRMWPRFSDEDINMEQIDDEIMKLCDESSQDSIANAFASLYSTVVARSLRLRGMLTILNRLDQICLRSAEKIWSLFLKYSYSNIVSSSTSQLFTLYKPESSNRLNFSNQYVKDMNLPSFFYLFLFFIKVPVDLLNQWLQMRIEKVQTNGFDLLTLNTLIEDSHDCLMMAIDTKTKFIKIISTTCQKTDEILAYLESFDINCSHVFQNYLSYLRSWVQTIAHPMCDTDGMWCEKLVNKLEKEWNLAKRLSSNVIRGESLAANRFCVIANDLFDSVQRFLTERFHNLDQKVLEDNMSEEDYIMIEDGPSNSIVLILCRELKKMTKNLRERALKSLKFLKTLCSDLEIAVRYQWDMESNADELVEKLLSRNHVMLNPGKLNDCNFVIVSVVGIVNEEKYIDSLLNATFAHSSVMPTSIHSLDTTTGYVLLIPSSLVSHQNRSNKPSIALSMNTCLNLSHFLTPNSIYLISGQNLQICRSEFETSVRELIPGRLKLLDDSSACNDQILEELNRAKESAFAVGQELFKHARELNEYILNGRDEKDLNQTEIDTINSTLLQSYNCAFEYYKELAKIIALPNRKEFYHTIVECLDDWAQFVRRTLRNIKRTTPIWYLAPINYLLSLPTNSFEVYLSKTDRDKFETVVKSCLDHLHSIVNKEKDSGTRKKVFPTSRLSDKIENLKLDEYYINRKTSVSERILNRINEFDIARDKSLLLNGIIGKVGESKRNDNFRSIFTSRKAAFEWQRFENKLLGRGSFGSVFLVMNLRDNCLMAMKQIRLPNDNNAMKLIADEVDILRNLNHPNLVKYYGVEIQNEEVMIFMEYCSEGTLARVCKDGLDLICCRRYTHYLLLGVNYLHDHGIIHRDIKPANIFLGKKNVLKLGDFGCSLRLQGTSTKIGEIVNNFAGTTAYSAPELHTCGGLQDKDSQQPSYRGYGRAVDIWSLGATVLEMLTGKKPYHYLDHELQIIFQLGSGIPPRIPLEIQKCDIAYSFLSDCFKVNPEERPNASTLLQHAFSNVVASIEQDSQDLNSLGFSQSQQRVYRR